MIKVLKILLGILNYHIKNFFYIKIIIILLKRINFLFFNMKENNDIKYLYHLLLHFNLNDK